VPEEIGGKQVDALHELVTPWISSGLKRQTASGDSLAETVIVISHWIMPSATLETGRVCHACTPPMPRRDFHRRIFASVSRRALLMSANPLSGDPRRFERTDAAVGRISVWNLRSRPLDASSSALSAKRCFRLLFLSEICSLKTKNFPAASGQPMLPVLANRWFKSQI